MPDIIESDLGETIPLSGPYRSDGGFAYVARLPAGLKDQTDTQEWPRRSRLTLLEDGRPLGPGHATHPDIRRLGQGRFSFWNGWLWFSSSDGSDPNGNGRRYAAARRAPRPDAAMQAVPAHPEDTGGQWVPPDRPLQVAIIGVGQRGFALARLLRELEGVSVSWLVDVSLDRIREAQNRLDLGEVSHSSHWESAIYDPEVDAVFLLVPDHLHASMTVAAFRGGKDVYLEKPAATTLADARAIVDAWQESGRRLCLGYVLRHAPFYRSVRDVARGGAIGRVRTIALAEHLGVAHGASFMRRWHRSSMNSGGLMIHKGCHDLDLACWLTGATPLAAASFGGRDIFRRDPPAPFCSQCPEQMECPYVDTGAYEFRTAAEAASPTAFGLDRCVYNRDVDIVDNQVVLFELSDGTRGTFQLNVGGPRGSERFLRIVGDAGVLEGSFGDGQFRVLGSDGGKPVEYTAAGHDRRGHGGGDRPSVLAFLDECLGRRQPALTTTDVLAGLALAFAAEEARLKREVVHVDQSIFFRHG